MQKNLSIDRQLNQIRQRDKIIRQLWLLALILVAIILVLAMMLLIATKAQAVECRSAPDSHGSWTWRYVEPRAKVRCWYQGRHVIPKSQLHWRAPAENKPLIIDEIKNHRAEAPPIDANGDELTPYDEVMEKPQPPDDCCWPPLDERSFKSRWDEIPVGWRL